MIGRGLEEEFCIEKRIHNRDGIWLSPKSYLGFEHANNGEERVN